MVIGRGIEVWELAIWVELHPWVAPDLVNVEDHPWRVSEPEAKGDEREDDAEEHQNAWVEQRDVLSLHDGAVDERERAVVNRLGQRPTLIRELREGWIECERHDGAGER